MPIPRGMLSAVGYCVATTTLTPSARPSRTSRSVSTAGSSFGPLHTRWHSSITTSTGHRSGRSASASVTRTSPNLVRTAARCSMSATRSRSIATVAARAAGESPTMCAASRSPSPA